MVRSIFPVCAQTTHIQQEENNSKVTGGRAKSSRDNGSVDGERLLITILIGSQGCVVINKRQ